jgi:hypothetical protein
VINVDMPVVRTASVSEKQLGFLQPHEFSGFPSDLAIEDLDVRKLPAIIELQSISVIRTVCIDWASPKPAASDCSERLVSDPLKNRCWDVSSCGAVSP